MFYDPDIAIQRSKLMQKVRDFFNKDFLEVETPIMCPIVDMEPTLTPFETTLTDPHNNKYPVYLVTSPEFQMKKLLGAGFGNIYNIMKVFRNGEVGGGRHNPEFSMIEWYRVNADYTDIMNDCENLTLFLNNNKTTLTYQGKNIDLTKPWPRYSMHQLFLEKCNIDLLQNKDFETFKKTAEEHGHSTSGCETWDDILYKIFLNDIEPYLGENKPVFVCDYPATQGALAKLKKDNPFWVERCELYIAGQELCNMYSELTDAKEQRKRFDEDREIRQKQGKTVFDIDEEFLTSLESISQPCGGNALGLDRLFMLLMDKKTIEEVLLFPMSKMLNQ